MNYQQTLPEAIMEFLLGKKYYANIIRTKGTERYEFTSMIHSTREAAKQHRHRIEETLSFEFVETVSFRSRKGYKS